MVKKLIELILDFFRSEEKQEQQKQRQPRKKGIGKLYPNRPEKPKDDKKRRKEKERPKNIAKSAVEEEEKKLVHENLEPSYRVTEDFTYGELIASDTAEREGIENIPDEKQIQRIFTLTEEVLQPIRNHFGQPVQVTSGFRGIPLNRAIGGADSSQHTKGEAADIVVGEHTVNEAFEEIVGNFDYDQIIWEFGNWIHISYTTRRENRGEILTAKENEAGQTYYTKWTVDKVKEQRYLD